MIRKRVTFLSLSASSLLCSHTARNEFFQLLTKKNFIVVIIVAVAASGFSALLNRFPGYVQVGELALFPFGQYTPYMIASQTKRDNI